MNLSGLISPDIFNNETYRVDSRDSISSSNPGYTKSPTPPKSAYRYMSQIFRKRKIWRHYQIIQNKVWFLIVGLSCLLYFYIGNTANSAHIPIPIKPKSKYLHIRKTGEPKSKLKRQWTLTNLKKPTRNKGKGTMEKRESAPIHLLDPKKGKK